ncbi:hypothetical protein V8E51_017255 [Hyaloscypha variabilis]
MRGLKQGCLVEGGLSVGLLKGYRRADSDYSTKIKNIKRKLGEVKTSIEKEVDKLKIVEAANPTLKLSAELELEGRGRVLKSPLTCEDPEVDDNMEVDNGEDEMELEVVLDLTPIVDQRPCVTSRLST